MKTLDLYITKICNLNCEYCYVDLNDSEIPFNYWDFSQRINLLDYDHIKFFWGEPLLKWNEIKDIVESVINKNSNIKFTIVTNWLLIDIEKINFIKKYNIEIIVSVHRKWLLKIKNKFLILLKIKELVWFSFIFEEWNLKYPYRIFFLLQKIWFINFIFSPEVFSNWNIKNINKLNIELYRILYTVSINKTLNIKWIDWEYLKQINFWCEKYISLWNWEILPCNRFKKLEEFEKIGYKWIYDEFDKIINIYSDKNRWFYVCPIWWYLDSLWLNISLKERIIQYKNLNLCFINFFKKLNYILWKRNFLADNINELRFNLTSQCNLRCEYCYIDFKNEVLNKKTAENIIKFLLNQNWIKKTISFFGWEPLLEFLLLKDLVLFTNNVWKKLNKKISYKIATNWLLLDKEKIHFLKQNNFEIHLSLNWTKNINNITRDNSFLKLEEKINLLKYYENVVILMVIFPNYINSLNESIKQIKDFWFKKILLEIYLWNKYIWNNEKYKELENELIKLNNSWIFNSIELINLIDNSETYLDISTDWKINNNSLEFFNNKIDFESKKELDRIINKLNINKLFL